VIEIDGITHNEPVVKENDNLKNYFIKSIGFNILRFTDDEVSSNMNRVIEKIKNYIRDFEYVQT
jgi:5-methyltetrahydrofolate--homocysteine methyltransferase/leucyl-tRNA synthetase/methylmalonyl-CoA mutase